jgi:dTDP-4-dehydrorhamnose reductase
METMEMINIINQNRNKVYESKKHNFVKMMTQKKAKKEKISNLIAFIGYLIGAFAFAQIVTLLVK